MLAIDVSGGHSPSILNAMRSSLNASRGCHFQKDMKEDYTVISHHHAFYMATLGGAKGMCSNMVDEWETGQSLCTINVVKVCMGDTTQGFIQDFELDRGETHACVCWCVCVHASVEKVSWRFQIGVIITCFGGDIWVISVIFHYIIILNFTLFNFLHWSFYTKFKPTLHANIESGWCMSERIPAAEKDRVGLG